VRAEGAGKADQTAVTRGVLVLPPAPPPGPPRQLPPEPRLFTNRDDEVAGVRKLADDAGERASLVLLTGVTGVGKSCLSVRIGHLLGPKRFAGGQLYAEVGSRDVADILAEFLRALGVADDWLPQTLRERTALYRELTAGRELLVLLDDVADPAQVSCLLPVSGRSMVIATRHAPFDMGHNKLQAPDLWVPVAPLSDDHSLTLLAAIAGPQRLTGEPEAVQELVRFCGGLPALLQLTGLRLRRHGPSKVLAELADGQIFTEIFESLSPLAQRCYAVLGALAAARIGAEVVAAAAEVPLAQARLGLTELGEAGLVNQDLRQRRTAGSEKSAGGGRAEWAGLGPEWAVPSRVRQDARSRAPESLRHKLIDWYVASAVNADHLIMGELRLRLRQVRPPGGLTFTDPAQAWAWLEAEKLNLHAVLAGAMRAGRYESVWWLAEALWPLHWHFKVYGDWIFACDVGAEAALRQGEPAAAARLIGLRARARLDLTEFGAAEADLAQAAELIHAAAAGVLRRRVVASLVESAGFLSRARGDLAGAVTAFAEALERNVALGQPRGTALQRNHLGQALLESGEPEAALRQLELAERAFTAMGQAEARSLASVLLKKGRALHALGRPAAETVRRAVELAGGLGLSRYEADGWELLAQVSPAERETALRRAIGWHERFGSPRSGVLRDLLDRDVV
jgi:tetratricopeptide (TPR) repeat protein